MHLARAIVALFVTGLITASTAAAEKPNIIFILSDDVGLGNIGCYGGSFKTPNIDALAAEGTRFEHCYANPLCGPSRATCLTGRYVFRTGMLTNNSAGAMDAKKEVMVPKVLKPAGYVTAAVGKWAQLPLQPSDWGFDEYLRFQGSGKYWSTQGGNYTQDGATKALGDKYMPDVMHGFIVDFMTRHKDRPFYIHYAMSHMHGQILRTPDSTAKSDHYVDNNNYMDKLVGQLVGAIDKLGLREKTLIVFVGDNGTARQGVNQAKVDGKAISGQKASMLEGGSRVPLIVNWKGTTPAGKVLKDLTDFTDFLPTFADLAGAKLPEGLKIDGHSIASQVKGEAGQPREWIYVQLGLNRYVRNDRWKLTGAGAMFDLKEAPFKEAPVSADTSDADAKAGRVKLQAALDGLKIDDPGTAPPPKKKKKDKKKQNPTPTTPATPPPAPIQLDVLPREVKPLPK